MSYRGEKPSPETVATVVAQLLEMPHQELLAFAADAGYFEAKFDSDTNYFARWAVENSEYGDGRVQARIDRIVKIVLQAAAQDGYIKARCADLREGTYLNVDRWYIQHPEYEKYRTFIDRAKLANPPATPRQTRD